MAGEEYWNELVTAENPVEFGKFTKRTEQCFVKEVLGKPLPDPKCLDVGMSLTSDVDGTKDIEGKPLLPTVEQMYRDRSGDMKVWPEGLAQAVFHIDPPEKVVWTPYGNYRLNPFTRTVKPITDGAGERSPYIVSRAGGANQIPIQCSRGGNLSRGEYSSSEPDWDRSAREDTDTLGLGSMLTVDRMMQPERDPDD